MSMEVIATADKAQRDKLFEDLRRNGNELERQVVKFSSNQPVLDKDGEPMSTFIQYEMKGKGGKTNYGKIQRRWSFVSTWSVAYPNS